ncbi:MAG: ComEC/Rec2 family competence protein [Fimbriimonadaceae bacterium]|nr:ComEC/Rec2 family competence protein [Fimbriimonadaceae bacterium]
MRAELEARPLLVAVAGLAVGLASPLDVAAFPLLIVLLLLVRSWELKRLACWMALLGLALAPRGAMTPLRERSYFEGTVSVATVPRLYPDGSTCEVEGPTGRFSMWVDGDRMLALGDVVRVKGVLRPLPDGSDAYWHARGVSARLQPASLVRLAGSGGVLAWGVRWRAAFVRFCGATMVPEAARVVDAVCFNVSGELDTETRTELQRSGTTHIVSASGLHVLIFAFALQMALVSLPIPRWAQLLLLLGVLVLYAAATGFRPPVVRAVIMAAVYAAAYLFRREPDALSALALAGLAYLVFSPRSLQDAGFQLSFATVFGLALFLRARRPARGGLGRLGRGLVDVARTSLAATLASGPLVAYHFGMVSLASVPANVMVAFVLPPMMTTALAALAASWLLPSAAAGAMGWVVQPLAGWVLWVVSLFGSQPWAAVEIPPFHPYWIAAYYFVWLAFWRRVPRPVSEPVPR